MILLANSLIGLASLLGSLIWLVQILIICRVVVSWLNADPHNRLVQIIVNSTEPMLAPIRRIVPPIGGGLDFSPIILLFAAVFLNYALVDSMREYALLLKVGQMGAAGAGHALPSQSF